MANPLHGQLHVAHEQLQQQPAVYFQGAGDNDGQPPSEPPQVCSFYMRTGTCAYGNRCKFYHPHPSEVPPPILNSRGYPVRAQGEPDCAHFLKKGWCAFGMTCKFNHPELQSGPSNLALASAQPGNVLLTSAGSNTTLVQGPVVYTAGTGGQAYQTVLQAPQAVQPGTTVYYVPTASGTSIMVAQAPTEGQQMYTSAPPSTARTIYATPGGSQIYTGTQYVEPQLLGGSGMQLVSTAQHGRPSSFTAGAGVTMGGGILQQQQPPGGRSQLRHSMGAGDSSTAGTVTYIQDEPSSVGQQLPTSYLQGLATPMQQMQQMQQGGYLQQAAPGGNVRGRQQLSTERHVMLPGRAGESSHLLQLEGVYNQGTDAASGNLMLYVDSSTGRYTQVPSGSSVLGSNLPSGSMHSGQFTSVLGPGAAGASSQQPGPPMPSSATQEMLSSWHGQGPASQERLVQAMHSLRLQQQQMEQYEQPQK